MRDGHKYMKIVALDDNLVRSILYVSFTIEIGVCL